MKAFCVGIAIVLVFLGFYFQGIDQPYPVKEESFREEEKSAPLTFERDELKFITGNPFTEEYGETNGDTKRDLEALRDVVTHCQLLMKNFDTFHLPGNPEIVRFLQGANPEKLAWMPAEHRLIQSDGVLLDRNGIPIFFHRLSGLRFEYRSAGPDRKHWTDDDVVVR